MSKIEKKGLLGQEMSRRKALKLAGVGAVGATLLGLEGCSVGEEDSRPTIEKLVPVSEAEQKVYASLQVYDRLRKANKDIGSQEAAMLLPVAKRLGEEATPVAGYKFFRETQNAEKDEATVLEVASVLAPDRPGNDVIAAMYQDAKNRLGDFKGHAANITSMAAFSRTDVSTVLSLFPPTDGDPNSTITDENVAILPLFMMDRLTSGTGTTSAENHAWIVQSGIKDKQDQASLLYATTFTEASRDEVARIFNDLVTNKFGANVRGDLLLATIMKNGDLATVTSMYDFAGKLKGMSQEAAAKIVLETISDEQAAALTDADDIAQNDAVVSRGTHGSGYYHSFVYFNHTYAADSGWGSGRSGSTSSGGRGGITGSGTRGGGG